MSKTSIAESKATQSLAQGATPVAGGVHFRVWAPGHERVELLLADGARCFPLLQEADGYWSLTLAEARVGMRYRYRVDGNEPGLPDPASRFLPDGPHGPSEIVDPRGFAWTDLSWTGLPLNGQVIYELHVGTFSPEGTWQGARPRLEALRELGVTVIELMPVSEFPGAFGWGYDGVAWFAPSHLYGLPDDFRAFVDQAHRLGIGVILDVVYNHLGPDGNYLDRFSPHYFSAQNNEWGRAMNFDGAHSAAVRRLVTDNAAYWIDEFHLDGLRLDATQSLIDHSADHIIAALTRQARATAGGRRLLIIGENEPQNSKLLRSTALGGMGLDALWNDDFHHSAVVALTGRRQAYYSDYHGTASEWLAAAKHGFIFQGQRSTWQDRRRGHSARGLPASAFVAFLENHDQIANSLWSTRLWQQSSPACHRAMTALLLLGPWTPMLFQGQEWNASAPFHYFADHTPELAKMVRAGRMQFMSQFPGCAAAPEQERMADPASPELPRVSRLSWDERALPVHARALRLHHDLLALRRSDATLSLHGPTGVALEIAALTPTCALLRYFVDGPTAATQSHDRLLIVNMGADILLDSPTEPLLSPPSEPGHSCWRMVWSSEDPRYGGWGCAEPEADTGRWRIPGCATVFLAPMSRV